jgi:hypothetical protein
VSAGPGTTSRRSALAAAGAILAFAIAYMAVGFLTLDPASRTVPLLAGTVTVGLLLVELTRLSRAPVASARRTESPEPATPREWRVLSSVVALVAGFYLVGIVIVLPLYLVGAITLIGGKPLRLALAIAIATTAAIYAAFELLLSLRLFPGILFGA